MNRSVASVSRSQVEGRIPIAKAVVIASINTAPMAIGYLKRLIVLLL